MSDNMIQVKNVSKWYGPVQVLNDCSVNIDKGDVVVVCGPSGSKFRRTPLNFSLVKIAVRCRLANSGARPSVTLFLWFLGMTRL